MVICDRCFSIGEHKAAPRKIKTDEHETFGLCQSCYDEFKTFLDKVKPSVKKRKKKKQ